MSDDKGPNMRVLRQLFRRNVIGDCKSATFSDFWAAVKLYCPTADLSGDMARPTSSRTSRELLPAYELAACLLRGRSPAAWETFLANGSSADCAPVPELLAAVEEYLKGAPCDVGRPVNVRDCAPGDWLAARDASGLCLARPCVRSVGA